MKMLVTRLKFTPKLLWFCPQKLILITMMLKKTVTIEKKSDSDVILLVAYFVKDVLY